MSDIIAFFAHPYMDLTIAVMFAVYGLCILNFRLRLSVAACAAMAFLIALGNLGDATHTFELRLAEQECGR